MKKSRLLLTGISSLLLFACNQKPKTVSQSGVYKLDKQIINDGVKDTSYTGFNQYKIYTSDHYFYIATGSDSSAGFGLGSYTLNDGKAVEKNIFNSGSLDTAATFNLDLTRTEKGYTQVIPEMLLSGKKYKLTEEYTSVDSKGETAVDGLWIQTKSMNVKGKDTVVATYKEYKIYQGNHFAWAARYLADTAKNVYRNLVGYGSYSFDKDAAKETVEFSNMKEIVNQKFDMQLIFNGKDEFTQVTKDSASQTVNYKTYKKVK